MLWNNKTPYTHLLTETPKSQTRGFLQNRKLQYPHGICSFEDISLFMYRIVMVPSPARDVLVKVKENKFVNFENHDIYVMRYVAMRLGLSQSINNHV